MNTVEKLVPHLLLTKALHRLLGFVTGEISQRIVVREISQPLAQARPCEIRGQPAGPRGELTLCGIQNSLRDDKPREIMGTGPAQGALNSPFLLSLFIRTIHVSYSNQKKTCLSHL